MATFRTTTRSSGTVKRPSTYKEALIYLSVISGVLLIILVATTRLFFKERNSLEMSKTMFWFSIIAINIIGGGIIAGLLAFLITSIVPGFQEDPDALVN